MKREIIAITNPGCCCPGHDKYPSEAYGNRSSKRKYADSKAKEHRHARRSNKQRIEMPDIPELEEYFEYSQIEKLTEMDFDEIKEEYNYIKDS